MHVGDGEPGGGASGALSGPVASALSSVRSHCVPGRRPRVSPPPTSAQAPPVLLPRGLHRRLCKPTRGQDPQSGEPQSGLLTPARPTWCLTPGCLQQESWGAGLASTPLTLMFPRGNSPPPGPPCSWLQAPRCMSDVEGACSAPTPFPCPWSWVRAVFPVVTASSPGFLRRLVMGPVLGTKAPPSPSRP